MFRCVRNCKQNVVNPSKSSVLGIFYLEERVGSYAYQWIIRDANQLVIDSSGLGKIFVLVRSQ